MKWWERLFGQRKGEPKATPTQNLESVEWDPGLIVLPGLYRCCPIIECNHYVSRHSGRPMIQIFADVFQGQQRLGPVKILINPQVYVSLLDGLAISRTEELDATVGRWINIEVKEEAWPGGGGLRAYIKGPLL